MLKSSMLERSINKDRLPDYLLFQCQKYSMRHRNVSNNCTVSSSQHLNNNNSKITSTAPKPLEAKLKDTSIPDMGSNTFVFVFESI